MTLAQAIAAFAAAEAKAVAPDTWDARQRAFKTFSDFWGANTPVHKITRIKSAEWANALTARGKPAAKSYRANMVSHVAQVFAWLRKQGQPLTEDNPVKGLVVMTAAEKERRLNEGYTREAFEESDLPRIFSPKSLRRMRHQHGRWGALICLYTGARVGEVAQLFLRDFSVEDGLPCFRVCSESDGQTIKTPTSKRLVPIHPDLLRLGLMERVERLRAAGAKRFFPDMSIESKAGTGNAIGKSFSYLIKKLEIFPRREHGTLGIHGLRKNVIQALQASRMDSERRRALVGHDTEFDGVLTPDVHQRIYMRQWKATELSDYFTGIRWGEWIDFDGLRPLLNDAGK
jgi:integrase